MYTRGPCVPSTPPELNHFYDQGRYFTISNGIFKFNFLAVIIVIVINRFL